MELTKTSDIFIVGLTELYSQTLNTVLITKMLVEIYYFLNINLCHVNYENK